MTTQSKATTHAEVCWSWGPGHYECAVREIERLREALEAMVEMVEMNGFGRAYAMTIARAALAHGGEG